MSASPQELIFTAPFDEDDFTGGSGAGSIKVDGIIKGIKVFRESLFVFCEDSIFKITGSSSIRFCSRTGHTQDRLCRWLQHPRDIG